MQGSGRREETLLLLDLEVFHVDAELPLLDGVVQLEGVAHFDVPPFLPTRVKLFTPLV